MHKIHSQQQTPNLEIQPHCKTKCRDYGSVITLQ